MNEIFGDPFIAALKNESYQLMGASPQKSVLDVGCGTGQDLVLLARLVAPGGSVTGIDLSKAMIDEAGRTTAAAGVGATLRVADGDALPFPAATFDGVRAERILQHAADPLAVLREMVRVTRPGGRVLAIDADRGVFAHDFEGWDGDVAFRLGHWGATNGPVRNGLFSRQVRRHLLALGLLDVVAHARVNTSTAELERRPHLIDEYHARAVEAGVITPTEAETRGAAIRAAIANGTFHTTTLFWMTVGTVPSQ